jgi:hypothetical protein
MSVSSVEVAETATLYGLAAHTIRTLMEERATAREEGRQDALRELGEATSMAIYYSPLEVVVETTWRQQVYSAEVENIAERYLLLDAIAQEWDASYRVLLLHGRTREVYATLPGCKKPA